MKRKTTHDLSAVPERRKSARLSKIRGEREDKVTGNDTRRVSKKLKITKRKLVRVKRNVNKASPNPARTSGSTSIPKTAYNTLPRLPLSQYTCKTVRHELYEHLSLLLTRKHQCEEGIVDLISQYYYVASDKIFDTLGAMHIKQKQNPKGSQALELQSMHTSLMIWYNGLSAIEKDISWLTIPPAIQTEYDKSKEKITALRKFHSELVSLDYKLKSEQKNRRESRWGYWGAMKRKNDKIWLSKAVPQRTVPQRPVTQQLTKKERIDRVEFFIQRRLLKAASRVYKAPPIGEDSESEEDYNGPDSYYMEPDDSEINDYKLGSYFKSSEPANNTTLGLFLAELITKYYNRYHILKNLDSEQKVVTDYLANKDNWKNLLPPNAFLQKIMKLFNNAYAHGDVLQTIPYWLQGLHLIWKDEFTGTITVKPVTNDRLGSKRTMTTDLLPLVRKNPFHFDKFKMLEVEINAEVARWRKKLTG